MNRLLLIVLSLISCTVSAITTHEFSQYFQKYNACFLLYSLDENKIVSEYNPKNRCNLRISPNSTFKIPLSVMAFDQKLITQTSSFKWHGKKEKLVEWEQNQTPASWLKYSVVWVSQQIAVQLGYSCIRRYLAEFKYGNEDFSGDPDQNNGLTHAWLDSSLKISAMEQLEFLRSMLEGSLAVAPEAMRFTKDNMYQGKLLNGSNYYGKTGSGWHLCSERNKACRLRQGWFVGFIEHTNQRYVFISNLSDLVPPASSDKNYGGGLIKTITLQLLNLYFSK